MTPSVPLRAAATQTGTDSETAVVVPSVRAVTRRLRFEMAAHPSAAAQARRLTRTWLTTWAVCKDTCDSAELVVSELVTNAILHTSSRRIVCELTDESAKVRIAVHDEGNAPGEAPCSSVTRDAEEHGRGLLLVAAACSAWGAHESGPGLQVWAELPRGAARRTGIEADTVRGTGAEWVS